MKRGFYSGVNRTRRLSTKQVIANIEEAMKHEPEGSAGRQQYERALEYWRGRSASTKTRNNK